MRSESAPDPALDDQPETSTAPAQPARRRLWQLPAELRSLLLGLGLPPDTLRRQAERALARLHRRPVQLLGSDAEVLASVLHDLAARNAVSEALHDALAARHAAVGAHVAALREPAALQAAWRHALHGGDVPGTAWVLLTHPQGRALDEAVLVDLRGWALAQARAQRERDSTEALLRQAALRARAEADTLRLRLQHEQAAWARERETQAREQARLRGECEALRQAAAAPAAAPGPAAEPTTGPATAEPPPARPRSRRAVPPAAAAPQPSQGERTTLATPPCGPGPRPDTGPAPALHGRRVLCVGGMPGAQDRYRQLVETAGAEFDFHDGGLEQGLHRLDRQLGAADLVVCQAGCLNHEAYRRVKGHCRRADKACLFVQRPSLAHFARTLGLAASVGPGA